MTHYLAYWKPETVAAQVSEPLNHSASNQYGKVKSGDVLWIVTSEAPNDLVLVGRLGVHRIVGQSVAAKLLGTADLWDAEYHAIADQVAEKANLDISSWARELEFDGVVETLPDGFTGQHLQALRRLTDYAAKVLERIWARRNEC